MDTSVAYWGFPSTDSRVEGEIESRENMGVSESGG
jgi:hypothetical protein